MVFTNFEEVKMKVYDEKFSKAHLLDCINESADSAEICRLALKRIRALEKKIERISSKQS
jgi:hypothetical protein